MSDYLPILHPVTLSLCYSECHSSLLTLHLSASRVTCHASRFLPASRVTRHSVTLLLCHSVTLSLCHSVTLSLYNPVTLSLCYSECHSSLFTPHPSLVRVTRHVSRVTIFTRVTRHVSRVTRHSVTLLLCHPVTLSLCHLFTLFFPQCISPLHHLRLQIRRLILMYDVFLGQLIKVGYHLGKTLHSLLLFGRGPQFLYSAPDGP